MKASAGFSGLVGAALTWKPAVFVGKISYGVYVYHPLVPGALSYVLVRSAGDALLHGSLGVLIAVSATLGLSAASWFLLEKPINDLKERFR